MLMRILDDTTNHSPDTKVLESNVNKVARNCEKIMDTMASENSSPAQDGSSCNTV